MRELVEKTQGRGGSADTLTLPWEARQKSRQRVRLDSGAEAALLLAPGTRLLDGDLLLATDGGLVRVIAAEEPVTTVRCPDPLRLARACYHLGNRHVALQIGEGWLRYLPDHVLEDMLRGLGLETRQERAPFEPERGAYHGSGHSHAHGHAHDHSHPHDHPHDHSHGDAHEHSHAHGHAHAEPAREAGAAAGAGPAVADAEPR